MCIRDRPGAGDRFSSLKDDALLSFFRSLPWNAFLRAHLSEITKEKLLDLSKSLQDAASTDFVDSLGLDDITSSVDELVQVCKDVYKCRSVSPRALADIANDLTRCWLSLEGEDDAASELAALLDAQFIQESSHKCLQEIAKHLDAMKMRVEATYEST